MKPLSNQQRLHQVNTEQLFKNYRAAVSHAATYQYGMRWKTVRSTENLFRDKDRCGNGKPLRSRCGEGLQWLLNAPKLDVVAVDEDGWPVSMLVPDPLKKTRDLEQARSVAKLVVDEMPHLPFESTLTSLHADVRQMLSMLGALR